MFIIALNVSICDSGLSPSHFVSLLEAVCLIQLRKRCHPAISFTNVKHKLGCSQELRLAIKETRTYLQYKIISNWSQILFGWNYRAASGHHWHWHQPFFGHCPAQPEEVATDPLQPDVDYKCLIEHLSTHYNSPRPVHGIISFGNTWM